MTLFVGVDAGASHTAAAVGDEDLRVLGEASGPAGALQPGREEAATEAIAGTVRTALVVASADASAVRAAVVGAAGARAEAVRERARQLLRAFLPAPWAIGVTTDVEVALEAAFGMEPGIVLCAGTGSVALGRDRGGGLHWAGGLRPSRGDEGSGVWLGREALRRAGAAPSLGPASPLVSRLLAATGVDAAALHDWWQDAAPAAVAALALEVCRAGEEGDAAALELVARAGRRLAALVRSVHESMGTPGKVAVALSGGLLQPTSPVRHTVLEALARDVPHARVTPGTPDPPRGALLRARRLTAC
jgi:N-acetylglucosamine kinase-like BadF-type ATPase